jgi:hypothetical protein
MLQTNATLIALLAALLLAACGDSESGDTPSTDADAQVQSDSIAVEDTAQASDAVASEDAAQTSDATASEDAGPVEDTAQVSDALVPEPDAGSAEDVSAVDATATEDAAIADDATITDDTAVTPDAVTQGDTSGTEDTGPDEDAVTSECVVPCDCEQQGAACIGGVCILGTKPVFCCEAEGCAEGAACVNADGTDGLCGVSTSDAFGVLIINEVLTDGAVDGDPNADGDTPDAMGDEFIELVNAGDSALDLSGFQLFETDMPFVARHVFSEGTMIPAGDALVVFGGGTAPDDIEHAQFQVANANDPGTPLGLALNNDGDTLTIIDADGLHVATFAYGPGAVLDAITDESMARKPDVTGEWMAHTMAAGSPDALFSPGTKTDGTSF